MKGVTPIVVLVLLLVVSLVLVGTFAVFSQRFTSGLGGQAEQQAQTLREQFSNPKIESVKDQEILVRNLGSSNLSADTLAVFIEDGLANHTASFDAIQPNRIGSVTIHNLWEFGRGEHTLRVSSGVFEDTEEIEIEPAEGRVLDLRLEENGGTDGANLVANPGFETYTNSPGIPNSWNQAGAVTPPIVTRETVLQRTGANAVKIVAQDNQQSGIEQTITGLVAGKSYYVEAWARTGGAAGERAELVIYEQVDVKDIGVAKGTVSSTAYEKLSITFQAVAGKTYRLFLLHDTAANGRVIYFDDVVVQEIQAKDSAGGNHGTLAGATNAAGPTIGVAGKIGTAYEFDGVDDYVEVPDSASLRVTSVSLEAWIKPTAVANKNFFRKTDSYGLYIDANSKPALYIRRTVGGENVVAGTTTVTSGAWMHIVGTYDESTMKIYVNGNLEGTLVTGGAILHNTASLYVGAGALPLQFLNAVIDEARIYNHALAPDELYVMKMR